MHMSIKAIGWALYLLITTTGFTLLAVKNSSDFENTSELEMFMEAFEKNPNDIKDEDFKTITPLALAAAQSNVRAIKLSGLWLIQAAIRQDAHFSQFPEVLPLVRKAIKNIDAEVRGLSMVVLGEIVPRYTKIDEIKEEVFHIIHTAIQSQEIAEKREGFALYCALINRDKVFNQFDDLAHDIDHAMQSDNKSIQASGIWLLYKHVKRNLRFNDFKKAHAVTEIGMASSHKGMRWNTLALLEALINKDSSFSELPKVQHFALTEVRNAMATKNTAGRELIPAFTNSIALLSGLMDLGIEFKKEDYPTIEQAALRAVELVNAKTWKNALNMLERLFKGRITTLSAEQLTAIALQATKSDMPRVLSGGLSLLRTLLRQEETFVQFEATEQAALHCAGYDNTWVRCEALDVLIELLQKDKLKDLVTAEYVAQRSAHSSNDEEHRAGKHLLNLLGRKKNNTVFLFLFAVLAFLSVCYFVGLWLLRWLRNR